MSEPNPAPSIADGETALALYAALAAKADALEARLAKRIAPIKAKIDADLAPIVAEMGELKVMLEPWWQTHAATLTAGKKKSHELAGCVIGTRANPKKLVYKGKDEDEAIAKLRAANFTALVVRSYQLDKKAILARVEAEPKGTVAKLGFSILQDVTFFVDPATRSRKA